MVNWLPISILAGSAILLLFAGLVLHGLYTRVFRRIHEMELRYADPTSIRIIETVLKFSILVFVAYFYGFLIELSGLWPWFDDQVWTEMVVWFLPLAIIGTLVLAAVILGRFADRLYHVLADPLIGDRSLMSKNLAALLSILTRYLLYVMALLFIFLVGAITFGYGGEVADFATDFLLANLTTVLFLVSITVIGYATWRFLSGFFSELGEKSQRFSPQVFKMAEVGTKAVVIGIAILLVVFLILRSIGLGDLAQTVILLATTMVGLVVALSGSGSIGNALSGLVLIIFSPYNEGEMVRLSGPPGGDELIGEVVELGIIFTTVRDLQGQLVDVPNNVVLAGTIINQSDSTPYAIAVRLGLGYNLAHERVEELCMEAVLKTDNLLDSPEPHLYLVDFPTHYVDYRFHAYTDRTDLLRIRSDLMKNIKTVFDANGIEILSPVHEVTHPGYRQEGGILKPDDRGSPE